MKKVLIFIAAGLVLAILSVLIAAPIINDSVSKKIADELAHLPLPASTELVETVHKSGKLVGNGNGMQYFGAILIKSKLAENELREYYAAFAEDEWDFTVEKQADKNIKVIEHGELAFKSDIEEDNYYIVYSWGDNDTIFHELDIMGH